MSPKATISLFFWDKHFERQSITQYCFDLFKTLVKFYY